MLLASHREQIGERSLKDRVQTEHHFRSGKKFSLGDVRNRYCREGQTVAVLLEDDELFADTSSDLEASPESVDDIFNRAAQSVDHRVVMDKRIYGGTPCVVDTRVPVYAILELVQAGYSHRKMLRSFPTVTPEGLDAALRFAIHVMEK